MVRRIANSTRTLRESSRGNATTFGWTACPGVESVTPPRQDTQSWDVSSKRRSWTGCTGRAIGSPVAFQPPFASAHIRSSRSPPAGHSRFRADRIRGQREFGSQLRIFGHDRNRFPYFAAWVGGLEAAHRFSTRVHNTPAAKEDLRARTRGRAARGFSADQLTSNRNDGRRSFDLFRRADGAGITGRACWARWACRARRARRASRPGRAREPARARRSFTGRTAGPGCACGPGGTGGATCAGGRSGGAGRAGGAICSCCAGSGSGAGQAGCSAGSCRAGDAARAGGGLGALRQGDVMACFLQAVDGGGGRGAAGAEQGAENAGEEGRSRERAGMERRFVGVGCPTVRVGLLSAASGIPR